ncbi:MAG: hypothetical protein GXZ08_06600 [Tissierellia bacterium]|nr:hypothetical protein [Tissierellia bacterium]
MRFSVEDLDSDFATYTSANENIEATKDSKIYLVTLAISMVLLISGFISSKILFIGSIVFLLVSIALYMKNSKLGNNIEIDTIGDIHTKYDVQDYESFRDLYYKEKAKIELINRQREIEYERVKKLGETKAKLKELDEKHESINSTLEILCSGQGIDNKQQFDSIKMYKNEYEKLVFKRVQLMNSSENILRGRETTDISKLYEVNIEDKQKYESLAKNYESLKKTLDYNNSKRQNILGQMNKLEYDLDKLNDLTIKRENLNNALEDYNHKKYEIEETKKILNELSSVGNRGIMPMIVEKTEEFLSLVTENKYTKVLISDDHDIKIYDSKIDSYIDIDSLSTGTIDQVYLAYKLAVVDSLGDNLPIIFDDSFINYDDYRLENTLKGLSKIAKEHQIILFTCQIREENLLEKQNIEFNKIYL